MSTWDDKPNNYEHALREIERLRAALSKIEFHYANQDMSHVDFRVMAKQLADEALTQ